MKYLISFLLIVLLFLNCKKNKDNNADCRLKQTSYYNGTALTNSLKYEYDDLGRIKTITDADLNATTTYNYFPDSVVAISSKYKQVYFLKNALADSSSLIWFNPPSNFKYFYKYYHNAEGYVVSEREIFSRVQNGNTIVDTLSSTYTISNGNLVKAVQSPSGDEISFEYSTELRPPNNQDLPNSFKFPFLGKPSKNLPNKTLMNGGLLYTMTYEHDINENISKFIAAYASPGPTYSIQYVYTCN